MDLTNADVYVRKSDGTKTDTFRGTLSSKSLIVKDMRFDVEEGDFIVRALPNGREEVYLVRQANFSEGLGGALPPYWQMDIEKTTAIPAASGQKSTTVNIHNSTGIQVGDHNMMSFQVAVNEMAKKIDASDAPEDQKAEAKSRLQAFLSHPLTVGILGGIAGAIV